MLRAQSGIAVRTVLRKFARELIRPQRQEEYEMKRSGSQIYTSTSDLESAYRRLAADDLPDETKEVIQRFVNTWLARGVTKSRGVKLVYSLKRLAFILDKPFAEASRDDLIDLVGRLEGVKLAERTKYDLKVVLKTFYRWLKGGEDEQIPREVAWLKPRLRNRSHKLPEDLLTETEVLAMAQAATTPRGKKPWF